MLWTVLVIPVQVSLEQQITYAFTQTKVKSLHASKKELNKLMDMGGLNFKFALFLFKLYPSLNLQKTVIL